MPRYQLEREFVLEVGDVDYRRIARPSAIVGMMQELATRHAEELGLDRAARENCNAFWVLSRLKYTLYRQPKQYDRLRVVTWPRLIRGALWYRDFRFFIDDEEIGYAVTGWSIIGRDTHRLVRPKLMGVDVPDQTDGITETLTQIKCGHVEQLFDRTVHYSDIDMNRHLNNVKAVDILSDAIGLEEHPEWFVSELRVNYKAETVCGTDLTLLRGENEDGITIQAKAGEEEKLQALVKIST